MLSCLVAPAGSCPALLINAACVVNECYLYIDVCFGCRRDVRTRVITRHRVAIASL